MEKEEFNKLYEEWKELEKIIKSALTSGKRRILINSRDALRQIYLKNLLKSETEFLKELSPADRLEINKK